MSTKTKRTDPNTVRLHEIKVAFADTLRDLALQSGDLAASIDCDCEEHTASKQFFNQALIVFGCINNAVALDRFNELTDYCLANFNGDQKPSEFPEIIGGEH